MPQILDHLGATPDRLADVRTPIGSDGKVLSFTFVEYDGPAYYCQRNQKVYMLKEPRLIPLPSSRFCQPRQ